MPIADSDKKLLKQLKEAYKAKYGAPPGKRLCKDGCGKVKPAEMFTGYNKRCDVCIAVRQHGYWLKRQAILIFRGIVLLNKSHR